MKSQENYSQTLFESQENIFQQISTAFSQSSHSTNVGETQEHLIQPMEIVEPDCTSSYDLRTRTVIKQPLKKCSHTQSINPGISTSLHMEKSVEAEKLEEDDDDCSQESVSMLQELYQNTKNEFPQIIDSCLDIENDVISIYTDDEPSEEETVLKIEKATQTNVELSPKEKEIARNANFIKSIVKLKSVLSSKQPTSVKKTWNILENTLKGAKITAEFKNFETISKETVGYLIRSSDMENVFEQTVASVLQDFDRVFEENLSEIAYCWENSAYEMAVEMLCEAVDAEIGVWKMVDSFLCEKIASVLKDNGKSKNLILESKTNILTCFCQSTHLSYTTINFTIKKLQKLKTITQNYESLPEKISWTYLTKNSYYLIRLLESSLSILKCKVSQEKIEDVFCKKSGEKNYNVLEMWKKHWNKNEVGEEEEKKTTTTHEWEVVVNRWCSDLDEIVLHCVNHVPLLSMAVERCGTLAKDILKLCHEGLEKSGSTNKPKLVQ